MSSDDVTSFFSGQRRSGNSITNSTHTSVVPLPVDLGVRYVRLDPPSDGWVYALNSSGSRIPLCEYTKIKLLEKKEGRVYFLVLDGNGEEVGNKLSMKEEGAKLYLRKDTREEGITIEVQDYNWQEYVYSVQRNEYLIQFSGEIRCFGMKISITLASILDGIPKVYNPLPEGDYNLLAPDYPHTGLYSRFYRPDPNQGMFDLVWFPIEYDNNSRYLHMGHLSEGCVTVTNIKEWEALYHKIIRCRSDGDATDKVGGGKYVGKLIVTKDFIKKSTDNQPRQLSSF